MHSLSSACQLINYVIHTSDREISSTITPLLYPGCLLYSRLCALLCNLYNVVRGSLLELARARAPNRSARLIMIDRPFARIFRLTLRHEGKRENKPRLAMHSGISISRAVATEEELFRTSRGETGSLASVFRAAGILARGKDVGESSISRAAGSQPLSEAYDDRRDLLRGNWERISNLLLCVLPSFHRLRGREVQAGQASTPADP